ncbi:MAG: metallophosphoesterase [Candidatus Hydrogenedentes bacterium]|nr:metallophosphoesterase [Candidatus Hydrogenedentota bacterium]
MENIRRVVEEKESPTMGEREDEFSLQRKELWEKRIELEKEWNLYEGEEEDWINIGVWIKTRILEALLKLTGFYNRGLRNASNVQLRRLRFIFPNLPQELHGFKILFATDLHLSKKHLGWYISVESLLKNFKEEVDLILLGGDYRFGYFGEENFVVPLIRDMLASINSRYGVYGVMGNHDVSNVKDQFERSGIKILVNEGLELEHNSAKIWLGGVDDPHGFKSSDVSLSLLGRSENTFTILLSHSPDVFEESALWNVDLLLCGHTHGGQIAFPLIGPVYFNTKAPRKYGYGKWNYLKMQGYTSSGVGTTDVPVRFYTVPEIVIITLFRMPFEDDLTLVLKGKKS